MNKHIEDYDIPSYLFPVMNVVFAVILLYILYRIYKHYKDKP